MPTPSPIDLADAAATGAILIDPNNRLLGWSANDFSIYGGQPSVTIGAPRSGSDSGPYVTVPRALESTAPPSIQARAPDPQPLVQLGPVGPSTDLASGTSALSLTPAVQLPEVAASAPSATPAPAVPDPVGSGSLAPIAVVPPLTAAAEGSAPIATSVSSLAAPVLDLAPVAPPAAGLTTVVPSLGAPVLSLMTAATDVVPGVTTNLVQPVVIVADDLITSTVQTVADMAVDATTAVEAVTETVVSATSAVGATLDAAGVGATSLLDGVVTAQPLAAAAVTVEAVAAPATQAVGEAVGGAADLVLDTTEVALGGTDPVAGVATLVEMVETAEVFDLGPAADDAPSVTDGGSILDALALDEAPGALLGTAADDNAPDDHDDGGLLGIL
jgi:hypothetical protein